MCNRKYAENVGVFFQALVVTLVIGAAATVAADPLRDDIISGEPWISAMEDFHFHASTLEAGGSGGSMQCDVIDEASVRKMFARDLTSGLRPMPYVPHDLSGDLAPEVIGNWPYNDMGQNDGIYPRNYVNPVQHVKDVGHLLEEAHVEVSSEDLMVRLEQVLHVSAPDWARYLLIEFEPDDDQQQPGLFIRPHKPFVSGTRQLVNHQHETPRLDSAERTPIEDLAYPQAAYRSDNPELEGQEQYVLLTRDMDPAPAGLDWYIALAQMRSDEALSGTIRVWASGSNYRAPLAIRWFYTVRDEEEEVGFFDPTPREPDSNPGRTVGEAWRWLLWRATEQMLDEMDFNGLFPIHMVATSFAEPPEHLPSVVGFGGGSAMSGLIHPAAIAPGRSRARRPGKFQTFDDPTLPDAFQHLSIMPQPILEREMGTDACRASAGWDRGPRLHRNCDYVLDSSEPIGSSVGQIQLKRTTGSGREWDLSLNLENDGDVSRFFNLIRHEIGHALGFSLGPLRSQSYVASFDPPRRALDQPPIFDWSDERVDGTWVNTVDRRHFYGPITAQSPRNPWRDTVEPGVRINDAREDHSHLMRERGDDLAEWPDHREVMQQGGSSSVSFGVAQDIFADLGYASNTWSIQDRRLPRHWFDPERSGHGIDFRRIEHDDGSMTHFMHFYTFDSEGQPRWYIAAGEIDREAIFDAELELVTYDRDRSPPQQPDAARSGNIRLDLDPPIDHPACQSRREANPDAWLYAVMDWELDGETGSWCLEPVQFGDLPAFPVEASGSWYAGADDTGWGLSVITRNYGPRPIINTVLYYYDADGEPTWSWGVAGGERMLSYASVRDGVEVDLLHFEGFCRHCEPVEIETESAGSLRLRLADPAMEANGENWLEWLDVTVPGPVGGSWHREDVELMLLSSPHPDMYQ